MLSCLLLASQVASSAGVPVAPSEHLTELEEVRLVLLPVVVTGRNGRPVRGLEQADFRVLEEGVAQSISFFAAEEHAPVAVAFLLDVSGSMRTGGRLDLAKSAIHTFVGFLGPRDTAGLICFAGAKVQWVTDFTSDRRTFLERVDAQYGFGKTALYDALGASPELVEGSTQGRTAIVLFTDGLDNASELPMLQAVSLARRVNVPIYTFSFIPLDQDVLPQRVRDSLSVLERFSTETGGAPFAIYDEPDLDRALGRVADEFRFQYVLGYYPAAPAGQDSFVRVSVETRRGGLQVRTRSGYYTTP